MKHYFATKLQTLEETVWENPIFFFTCPAGISASNPNAWKMHVVKGKTTDAWDTSTHFARGVMAFGAIRPSFGQWELSARDFAIRLQTPSKNQKFPITIFRTPERDSIGYFANNTSAICFGTPDKRLFVLLAPSGKIFEFTYDFTSSAPVLHRETCLRDGGSATDSFTLPTVFGDLVHWPGSTTTQKNIFSGFTQIGWDFFQDPLIRPAPFCLSSKDPDPLAFEGFHFARN